MRDLLYTSIAANAISYQLISVCFWVRTALIMLIIHLL